MISYLKQIKQSPIFGSEAFRGAFGSCFNALSNFRYGLVTEFQVLFTCSSEQDTLPPNDIGYRYKNMFFIFYFMKGSNNTWFE